jgi:hypothetical protein
MFRSLTIIRELVLCLSKVMLEHYVIGYVVVWQQKKNPVNSQNISADGSFKHGTVLLGSTKWRNSLLADHPTNSERLCLLLFFHMWLAKNDGCGTFP